MADDENRRLKLREKVAKYRAKRNANLSDEEIRNIKKIEAEKRKRRRLEKKLNK